MKLYIISDDISVRDRWINAFSEFNPIDSATLPLTIDSPSILMVLDRVIADADEAMLNKLFKNRVMVLSMIPNFTNAQRFLQLGAMGYGNAMMHVSHLHSAYQALEEGKIWLYPDFISLMITQIRDTAIAEKSSVVLNELSKREQEVALMLGNGSTHQQIADALDITVRTVKAHASSIYQKLDVKDRLALSLLLHT